MFVPPPSLDLSTTVRDINTPLIILATILSLFLVFIIFLFLCLLFRNIQPEHHPLPIPATYPAHPARQPIVSRLALTDLLGVTSSGSSLSDIDSAAPLFYVHNHPDHPSEKDAHDVCAVCLDALENGQRARRLPCAHVYHDSCAVVWLVKADRCPICAQPVVQKDHQQQQRQQEQQHPHREEQQQHQPQPHQHHTQTQQQHDTRVVITRRPTQHARPPSRFFSLFRLRR